MEREIKFRAWHKEQKKMYSAEVLGQDQLTIMPDSRGFANIHSVDVRLSKIDDNKKMIPLQYTGLKDKNGKEIYEGDIIKFLVEYDLGQSSDYKENINVVKWVNSVCGFKPFISQVNEWDYSYSKFEVIGNIYENPGLIKNSK